MPQLKGDGQKIDCKILQTYTLEPKALLLEVPAKVTKHPVAFLQTR